MNYLIKNGIGGEYYFHKPYEGICMKRCDTNGKFGEHTQIVPLGKEPFSVLKTHDSTVHILCLDGQNRLIYAKKRNNVWKKHTLSSLNPKISVLKMQIYTVNERLNLLYSARFNGEILLIHCILTENAKPSCLAKLSNHYFCIFGGRVFYTAKNGALGFTTLDDEKPEFFNKLFADAQFPILWEFCGKENLAFIHDSRLYIDGREIVFDEKIEHPVFVRGTDRLYLMWKSSSFIRYISSFNGGITWSEPMRFISTGTLPKIYSLQNEDDFSFYYGYERGNHLTLLGASNLFENRESFATNNEQKNPKINAEQLNQILTSHTP